MVEVGQKVRFDPFDFAHGWGCEQVRGNMITGTVVYVNESHNWFSVEYGDPKMRISFKFNDIGQTVKLVEKKMKERNYNGSETECLPCQAGGTGCCEAGD